MKKYTFADSRGELGNEDALYGSLDSLRYSVRELINCGELENKSISVYSVEEIGIAELCQTIVFTVKEEN